MSGRIDIEAALAEFDLDLYADVEDSLLAVLYAWRDEAVDDFRVRSIAAIEAEVPTRRRHHIAVGGARDVALADAAQIIRDLT